MSICDYYDIRKRKLESDSDSETTAKVTGLIGVVVDEPYFDPWTSNKPLKSPIKPGHVTGFYLPRRVSNRDPLKEKSKIQINIFYIIE